MSNVIADLTLHFLSLAATAQAVIFQLVLSFHTHAKRSAARKPLLGLTLPKEAFISSYRQNVTFLSGCDFASSGD